ncbi:multidrug efflux SMR transporter [Spirillospora sp. NPDC052269]
MAWVLIVVAGLLEVAMASCLKLSKGFSQFWPSAGFLFFAVASFGLLSLALKSLDIGTAYAVWTGIGAVGTATLGIVAMGDSASPMRIGALVLIVIGIIGLNLAGSNAH